MSAFGFTCIFQMLLIWPCDFEPMTDGRDHIPTDETTFDARMDRIRVRFAIKLVDNIQRTETTLTRMTGDGRDAAEAVATAYRWLHEVCGVAPTLGFKVIGRSARLCTAILAGPFWARRKLSADELFRLTECVRFLRGEARREMQSLPAPIQTAATVPDALAISVYFSDMGEIRTLHVDDEPDSRDTVEISLGLDPAFVVRSCGSGKEALAIAAGWTPDIILLDVVMPGMDGLATLIGLRDEPKTIRTPIIFVTAHTDDHEINRLRALGAVSVIGKPFDPMTLSASVRGYLRLSPGPIESLRTGFLRRVHKDVSVLLQDRLALKRGTCLLSSLHRIKRIAHSLAGAGGIYGFAEISDAAAAVEDAAIAELGGRGLNDATGVALDILISQAERSGMARAR